MTEAKSTGRYHVRMPSGRVYTVEPVEGRVNESKEWRVGGAQAVRGGSVPEAESVITPANGYTTIGFAPNPMDYIAQREREHLAREQ
jgi:hypothetical protein